MVELVLRSAAGCAVIISNRGGLPETVTNAHILDNLSINSLYKALVTLIENTHERKNFNHFQIEIFILLIDTFQILLIDIEMKNFK